VVLALAGAPAAAEAGGISFKPGAPGIGDPYFPLDGNGGYDVSHYGLTISYDPDSDVLRGVAKLDITAKQDLSSFNLDLIGMNVRLALVDGWPARVTRSGGEMTVKPLKGIKSTPTTARTSPASRTPPRTGTRSTTIRSTRRPTTSRSPSRAGWRRSRTASSRTSTASGRGRPGSGRRRSRWRRT
jgi:hypothetical protein